jgi:ethanolamine ammonia-lyase small subunit
VTDRPSRELVERTVQASWLSLRKYTPARIAIGRAGFGLPTRAYLDFQAAHARARDAVHAQLDVETMAREITARGWPVIVVTSAAESRPTYLRMPDRGRALSSDSKTRLSEPMLAPDVVIVVGDGLSSIAVERNALPVLELLCKRIPDLGLRLAPIILASGARVALADEIGEVLQAKLSIILIGERPGLSAADSLGMYLTFEPRRGRVDSERNCISNIHAAGMSAEDASSHAIDLIKSMLEHLASGVALAAGTPRLSVAAHARDKPP